MFSRKLIPFLLLSLFLFVACGKSNLEKLNGAWECDVKATMEISAAAPQLAGLDDKSKEMALSMAQGILKNIKIKFDTANKKLAIMAGETVAEETAFTVESDSGDIVVLQGTDKIKITFRNDTTIVMESGTDKMVLSRSK